MVTRNLMCPDCGHTCERIALGMGEPDHKCECGNEMDVVPSFPGTKPVFIGTGFHCNDYPPSAEQKIKDFGLERHDSTNDHADYHEEGYDGS
jgi:hypothetical protein